MSALLLDRGVNILPLLPIVLDSSWSAHPSVLRSTTMAGASDLCKQCRSIFQQEQEPEDGGLYLHHPDRKHLDIAAASGCMMCQVLLTEISSSSSAVRSGPNIVGGSKWTIMSELGDDDTECYEVTLWYMTYITDSRASSEMNARPKTASMNQVRFWLQPAEGMCRSTKVCYYPTS